jgi:CBS domain-containing protein
MNAVDVMTQPVISVTPEATIAEVAQRFCSTGSVGCRWSARTGR